VTHDAGRVDPQDPAVPHLDGHRIAAVAARLQVVEFIAAGYLHAGRQLDV